MTTEQNDPRVFSNRRDKVSIAALTRAKSGMHPATARAHAARNKHVWETVWNTRGISHVRRGGGGDLRTHARTPATRRARCSGEWTIVYFADVIDGWSNVSHPILSAV